MTPRRIGKEIWVTLTGTHSSAWPNRLKWAWRFRTRTCHSSSARNGGHQEIKPSSKQSHGRIFDWGRDDRFACSINCTCNFVSCRDGSESWSGSELSVLKGCVRLDSPHGMSKMFMFTRYGRSQVNEFYRPFPISRISFCVEGDKLPARKFALKLVISCFLVSNMCSGMLFITTILWHITRLKRLGNFAHQKITTLTPGERKSLYRGVM